MLRCVWHSHLNNSIRVYLRNPWTKAIFKSGKPGPHKVHNLCTILLPRALATQTPGFAGPISQQSAILNRLRDRILDFRHGNFGKESPVAAVRRHTVTRVG
jgi:hypothetical protein